MFLVRLGKDGKPVPYLEKTKEEVSQERDLHLKASSQDEDCPSCYGAETDDAPCCRTCDGRKRTELPLTL